MESAFLTVELMMIIIMLLLYISINDKYKDFLEIKNKSHLAWEILLL